jgi:NarL family two-component system response regulator LiaR
MTRLRLLLVDDVPQVREGLRTVLGLNGGIEVVGEAANGQEAVDLAVRLRPDVVLMDMKLPVLDGCEAIRQIKDRLPECRVVAVTIHGDDATRREAHRAGADAFLVKGVALSALVRAISEG